MTVEVSGVKHSRCKPADRALRDPQSQADPGGDQGTEEEGRHAQGDAGFNIPDITIIPSLTINQLARSVTCASRTRPSGRAGRGRARRTQLAPVSLQRADQRRLARADRGSQLLEELLDFAQLAPPPRLAPPPQPEHRQRDIGPLTIAP